MSRFALYEDYKTLYNKVVPPCDLVVKQVEKFGVENEQHKEIIRQFDENLQLRAFKTDIREIDIKLRLYVKAKQYKIEIKHLNH